MEVLEAFYGGAAGGGKSEALLMAALQYVYVTNYSAILFRQTYADLSLPGALMDRAFDWLIGTDAHWNQQDKQWLFPSGASLNFGYLESEKDKYRYRSSEFQFIGFDELTNFTETQYRFMFSRLRRTKGVDVPLRMRSASNPGGAGHDWVKARFVGSAEVAPEVPGVFVSARLDDNEHLDREEYAKSLNQLDPVTRAQLLAGDWEAYDGGMFHREWFDKKVGEVPAKAKRVRYWDKAGTEDGGAFSAGVLVARDDDGIFYLEDLVKGQWSSHTRNKIIRQVAEADDQAYGSNVTTWIEQEPGSGGKESAEISVRQLAGYKVKIERVTGSKESRAAPLAAQFEGGNVYIKRADWNRTAIDEFLSFPTGKYKDVVDASSGAFNKLVLVQRKVVGAVV
jgi:predicted phage terminase large subunit-like protein